MTHSATNDDDAALTALATRADREIKAQEALHQSALEPRSRHAKARWGLAVSAATLGVSAAVFSFSSRWMEASDHALRQNLSAVVEDARRDIESRRSPSGDLPQALSDPHLASMVRYEKFNEGFRLTATLDNITVTSDQTGSGR